MQCKQDPHAHAHAHAHTLPFRLSDILTSSRGNKKEWIKSPDDAEDIMSLESEVSAMATSSATAQARSEEVRKQYVVVPDASETHRVCPICQEELKYVWHDETDEFVWMDAKQVGGRIFHASCHVEASKDRAANGGSRGGTPDAPASGAKRKAEVCIPLLVDGCLANQSNRMELNTSGMSRSRASLIYNLGRKQKKKEETIICKCDGGGGGGLLMIRYDKGGGSCVEYLLGRGRFFISLFSHCYLRLVTATTATTTTILILL